MLQRTEEPLLWMLAARWIIVTVGSCILIGCGGGGNGTPGDPGGGSGLPGTGEARSDTTPPGVPTNVSATVISSREIKVSWSGATDDVGVTAYKVYRNGTAIASVASTDHSDANLDANAQHCYEVSASDAAGNESARSTPACATTAAATDATPPSVTSTDPVSSATDVAVDASIAVVFGEAMDASTLTAATFTVVDVRRNPVAGTLSYSGTTAIFVPTELLAATETFTATITTGARDVAGNALATAYSWTFKTGVATYSVAAIGDDPAGAAELFTLVNDLNEKGEVVGEAIRTQNDLQESLAFLWREGSLTDLGALSSSVRDSRSQAINDSSEVAGWSYAGEGGKPAFVWRDDSMTSIGLDDAFAINDARQVVGFVNRAQEAELISVAVVWQDGQVTELEGLVNPWSINAAGDVVGFSMVSEREQASLWRAGVVTMLGLLPGAASSQAYDINDEGLIVGTNQFAPPESAPYSRAFLWQSDRMTELPRIATNHTASDAYGINDRGLAVGRSGAARFSAALWAAGAAYDLNELIAADDPLKPYVTLLEAREINNRGQIIVQGTDSRRSGSYTGYLLTPKRAR